jgi:hypothetical protein
MSATTVADSRIDEHHEEENDGGRKLELKNNDDKVITTYVSLIITLEFISNILKPYMFI